MISNLNMVTQSGESLLHNFLTNFSSKELPSERFYEWLNSNVMSISQYYDDCNSLSDTYKGNRKIKRLCAKLVKYIKSTPTISNEEHLKDHHCNLLSYWIYEQLVSYYEDNSPEPVHIFGNFLGILSELEPYLNDNKCTLDYRIAMIQDRKEKKELYEYCIDYKTILEKSQISKDKCNKYYTYVEKKIELYKKFQGLCSSGDKGNCPDFFYKICEHYDPQLLLDKLNCVSIGVEGKPQQEDATHTDSLGTRSNSSPSIESVSKFGHAFLGVVVASMSSGFLYKFTPLGTRIRNGLLWNNNNISNLNTNGDELFVQESYSPYSGEEQHYIGYHAS